MQKPLAITADDLDRKLSRFLYRWAWVRAKNMPHFARRFCEQFRLTELPRDPFSILPNTFGIELERETLGRATAAQRIRINGSYTIQHTAHRRTEQITLSLWHEFAEIMFAHPRFPSRIDPERECRLATLFAVNVMMPEADLRAAAEDVGHPDRDDKTVVLASRFSVSVSAMRLRLAELGLKANRYVR